MNSNNKEIFKIAFAPFQQIDNKTAQKIFCISILICQTYQCNSHKLINLKKNIETIDFYRRDLYIENIINIKSIKNLNVGNILLPKG